MLLILQIAINVVSFLHFDTTSTESDTKLDEKRDSFIWMFFFFLLAVLEIMAQEISLILIFLSAI